MPPGVESERVGAEENLALFSCAVGAHASIQARMVPFSFFPPRHYNRRSP